MSDEDYPIFDNRPPHVINQEVEERRKAETNGHDWPATPEQLILDCLDRGLSNDAICEAVWQTWPHSDSVEQQIARARRQFEGEASRMRAAAKQAEHHPITNVRTDGAALLDKVYAFLCRFVQHPSEAARVAHTLWTVHTHAMEAFDSTPRLAFLSPEPASGKTRGLEATEPLVPRPIEAVNVTAPYLFRKVGADAGRPTILYDEIDTVFGPKAKDNEEVRGLLNAGHRKGAVAGRCVLKGKKVETEEIPAYCAVALAGLGGLPDTILTRSIVIRMRRRAPDEEVEQWRRRIHARQGHEIRDQIELWAASAIGDVIETWPEMPPEITDRDADMWESLFVVADVAGGSWPKRAREAAKELVKQSKQSSPSLGVGLLSDLRDVFGDADKMPTVDILHALHAKEDAPWGDMRGKPLGNIALARLLKPCDIKPKVLNINGKSHRGYSKQDFHDAWKRYLPALPEKGVTPETHVTTEEK